MSTIRSNKTAVLAIILLSYTMIVLDISIVITALPKIQQTLGFTATGLSWVQSAYTLAFGGLLLLGARMGGCPGAAPHVHVGAWALHTRVARGRLGTVAGHAARVPIRSGDRSRGARARPRSPQPRACWRSRSFSSSY
jgi:hypothetical protein